MALTYLNNLFPRVDIEQLRYGLRHMSDFVNLPRRTALFDNSFVPSAIQQWNYLPCHLRQCSSLATLKRQLLRSKFTSRTVPLHFLHGDRLLSSLHARIRNNCSNLKYDLFVNHLSETNLCVYCNVPENAYHYFVHCTLFTNERLHMFHSTRNLHPLNCQLLLFGSEFGTAEQKIEIVEAVHKFINELNVLHNALHPSTLPYFPYSYPSPSIHTLLSLFPTYFISLY